MAVSGGCRCSLKADLSKKRELAIDRLRPRLRIHTIGQKRTLAETSTTLFVSTWHLLLLLPLLPHLVPNLLLAPTVAKIAIGGSTYRLPDEPAGKPTLERVLPVDSGHERHPGCPEIESDTKPMLPNNLRGLVSFEFCLPVDDPGSPRFAGSCR